MIPENIADEYRAVTRSKDMAGAGTVRAAWDAGHKFLEYNHDPTEIAEVVGKSLRWVKNCMTYARLSRHELEQLIDKHGVDSLLKLRMELVNKQVLPPGRDTRPEVTYMPADVQASLEADGFSVEAMRNVMKRLGKALTTGVVARINHNPDMNFEIQIAFTGRNSR